MPRNIDERAQRERRRGAWQSAWIVTCIMAFTGTLLLILRWLYPIKGFGNVLVFVVALLNFGTIIPVWILLKVRLREIEGGEEDAATEY